VETAEAIADSRSLRIAYEPLFAWFRQTYPALVAALDQDEDGGLADWETVRGQVDWSAGRPDRGEAIFRARACHTCHTGTSRIGPDLTGVTGRFARDDLFLAIVAPNRDVAPPYRVTVIETRDGRVYSGIVAFESADGVILQTSANETVRIATPDIATRVPGPRSLMPVGLLKDLKPADIADLYAYLRTLEPARRDAAALKSAAATPR
jgi:putative heme-binding domain-containing protein